FKRFQRDTYATVVPSIRDACGATLIHPLFQNERAIGHCLTSPNPAGPGWRSSRPTKTVTNPTSLREILGTLGANTGKKLCLVSGWEHPCRDSIEWPAWPPYTAYWLAGRRVDDAADDTTTKQTSLPN